MRKLDDTELKLWQAVVRTVTPFDKLSRTARIAPVKAVETTRPLWVLDLHNNTLKDAHRKVFDMIDAAVADGASCVTIITGKSGQICREFPMWFDYIKTPVVTIDVLNGGGAFRLHFRNRK